MINYAAIPLPIPFPGDPINVYLINEDPVTLIDCGPNSAEAREALKEQLAGHGLKLEGIRRILITHAHIDHYGLAAEVQRISGASVYMHNKELKKVLNRSEHVQHIGSYLTYSGLPYKFYQELIDYFKWETSYVEPPIDVIGVEDGCSFSFNGFELKGVLTPGHSIGHLCFLQEEGLLFAGDLMLEGVIPNPVIEPLHEQPLGREKSLEQYFESMELISKLEVALVLPGHGKPILDISKAFQWINMHYQKRKKEISQIAARRKVFNPFELTAELYNLKKPVNYYLAMSGVLGQLDLLEAEGKVMQLQHASGLDFSWIGS